MKIKEKILKFSTAFATAIGIITFLGHDFYNVLGIQQPTFPMNFLVWLIPLLKVLFFLFNGWFVYYVFHQLNNNEIKTNALMIYMWYLKHSPRYQPAQGMENSIEYKLLIYQIQEDIEAKVCVYIQQKYNLTNAEARKIVDSLDEFIHKE